MKNVFSSQLLKQSILVMDDTEMNRSLIQHIFGEKYQVYTAGDGETGMEILYKHEIDLVLLDVVMPKKDGLAVLEEMKSNPKLSDIPVIIITGEKSIVEKKAWDLGADDFIEQPYDAYIIRKRVENLLERYQLKRLRNSLNEQRRYRDIFDILKIAYWEWTRNDGYYHSAKYNEYAISEMEEEKIWDGETSFQYIHPDDVELMKQFMRKHPDDEVNKSAIVRCKMKDGSYRWTEMFSIAHTTVDGKLMRLTSVMKDVDHEWIKQKAELEEALVIAESANKAKSDFLGRVSHDMRTPLNVILSVTRMAVEEKPGYDMLLSYFDMINNEGSFLLRLINDVLDVQKMESDVLEMKPEPSNLGQLLNSSISTARSLAEAKGVEFKVSISKFIDNAKSIVDPLRIQQLLTNLLTNAIKYTPQGGKVELILENISLENNIATDRIIVRDTGVGMSPEFMEDMYEPFMQEDGGKTSTTRGTGLGLSIVKKIVEMMGGTITCTSEVGKGTEFTVILSSELILDGEHEKHEVMNYSSEEDLSLIGGRILLCEDHPMNAMIAMKLLKQKGLIVTHAENGLQGVEYFKASKEGYYDAIIMDVRMPVMDGIEATKEIRKLPRKDSCNIPIIAMTANVFQQDIDECLDAGMNKHIAKPIEPQELWNALYTYIGISTNLSKLKVLIVDDMEVNAAVVAEAINSKYDPIIVTSGTDALKALEENNDIIAVVTDIVMPEMDGQELIKIIRSMHEYDNIAVLANTQYGEQEKEEEILGNGADDFIYKPTTPAIVRTRLENVLMRRNNLSRSK